VEQLVVFPAFTALAVLLAFNQPLS
jgi:hypothetical protein